jgi:hypothetical protein
MLWIGLLFLGLWIAGMVTSYTMGGFIHVLLVLAIMVLLSRMIRGNRSSRLAEIRSSPAVEFQKQTE